MLDRMDMDMDMACSAIDVAKLKAMKPEDLKPEQYKDAFDKPEKYNQAFNHPCPFQRDRWRQAINKELGKMKERQVWTKKRRSEIPKDRRLVKSKWVFDIKRCGTFRARLVACGYSQVGGVDFTQSFSPVVNDITFRILLIAKIVWKLDSYLFDVETAFLLGTLEEEIYMEMPEGMTRTDGDCLLLLKTIYGLVQSARCFKKFWDGVMRSMGFKQSVADPCLYARGKGRDIILLCLYVDDGYALGLKANLLKFFDELKTHVNITTEESMGDYT